VRGPQRRCTASLAAFLGPWPLAPGPPSGTAAGQAGQLPAPPRLPAAAAPAASARAAGTATSVITAASDELNKELSGALQLLDSTYRQIEGTVSSTTSGWSRACRPPLPLALALAPRSGIV
jgi:hypothetical protein